LSDVIVSSTCLALYQSPDLHRQHLGQRRALEVADVALDLDVAELVALALLDDVGDDEVAPVRSQLGDAETTRKSA
jgi:hypothetical protein